MCLYKSKKIQTDEDIVCYKVLYKNHKKELISPYYPIKWEVGKETVDDTNINYYFETPLGETYYYFTNNFKSPNEDDTLTVARGVFHTFKNKEDAVLAASAFTSLFTNYIVVYKCIIPAKSELIFEGEFLTKNQCMVDSYGSNRLKLIEEISSFKCEHHIEFDEIKYCLKNL